LVKPKQLSGTLTSGPKGSRQHKIGARLTASFVSIALLMILVDAVVLWQFSVFQSQVEHISRVDQKQVAILRAHADLLTFWEQLDALVSRRNSAQLSAEAAPLSEVFLEDVDRAEKALSTPDSNGQDSVLRAMLESVRGALPAQLGALCSLASAGDWDAVRLRLEHQSKALSLLTSRAVREVDDDVTEQRAQTLSSIRRVQRRVFLLVTLTAVFSLLTAGTLGLTITRSITQPLDRLVEGSKALARGEFQHQVAISGEDELAHLGQLFNDAAGRLRDLYATLQTSEDRLRLVINTIPANVWSTLPDGAVDFVNQRWQELTGLPPDGALGWNWEAAVHPDDRPGFVAHWHAAVNNGEAMEHEVRVRGPDGEYRWLFVRNVPLRDEKGNIVKWYGTSVDVEERKQAEQALRRSESYLSEAQRLSHTGSWAYKAGGGPVYWSEENLRIWGFDLQQGAPDLEAVHQRMHPEDRDREVEHAQSAARAGRDFTQEFRIVLPDGTVRHIQAVGHPVFGASGKVIEVLGTHVDVTERKRAEEALRRKEAYLAEAQRLTHTGSWAYNPGSRKTLFWSEEVFRIFGLDPQRGIPDYDETRRLVHPDDLDRLSAACLRGFREKAEFTADFRLLLQDGTLKHLHVVWHPVLDTAGELVEYMGTAADVTERKRAEKERETLRQLEADLAHVNRVSMMGEMAASLAHEIRQPIAAVITSADACLRWLARNPPDLERARLAVARVKEDGTRADDIIKRLRSFYKKATPPERERVDINEVIREMIVLLQDEAIRYSVSVRPELTEGIPTVMADRVQLQQVFMNLMLNAIEAMKDTGGGLTIKSQVNEDGQLLISVSDTGVGLPAENADLIFDAFYTTKPQGSGMGLAITRSIVESHGGRLWAAANGGRGATFNFTLRIEAEAHA